MSNQVLPNLVALHEAQSAAEREYNEKKEQLRSTEAERVFSLNAKDVVVCR